MFISGVGQRSAIVVGALFGNLAQSIFVLGNCPSRTCEAIASGEWLCTVERFDVAEDVLSVAIYLTAEVLVWLIRWFKLGKEARDEWMEVSDIYGMMSCDASTQ